MKKLFSESFINHLIVELKRGYLPVIEALESYEGEVLVSRLDKLNELYPGGWSVPFCQEVIKDLKRPFIGSYNYFGVCGKVTYAGFKPFGTLISHERYLELTGRIELKDCNKEGSEKLPLCFRHKQGYDFKLVRKDDRFYYKEDGSEFTYDEVARLKESEVWIPLTYDTLTPYGKLGVLAKILAKTMYYGDWKWENPNERVMQMIMEDLNLYPFTDEDDMIKKTSVEEGIYLTANERVKGTPKSSETKPQRDYTGVKFRRKLSEDVITVDRSNISSVPYHVNFSIYRGFFISQKEIESKFSKGDWIEVVEESISELDILKQKVKALEDTYSNLDDKLSEALELLKPKDTTPTSEPKFRKGDVVHLTGTVVVVTKDSPCEGSTCSYFEGIVIKDACRYFEQGFTSNSWPLNSFTKQLDI